jgi:outer membrane protein TolC
LSKTKDEKKKALLSAKIVKLRRLYADALVSIEKQKLLRQSAETAAKLHAYVGLNEKGGRATRLELSAAGAQVAQRKIRLLKSEMAFQDRIQDFISVFHAKNVVLPVPLPDNKHAELRLEAIKAVKQRAAKVHEEIVSTAKHHLDTARQAFERGVKDSITVSRARSFYLEARLDYIRSRVDFARRHTELLQAAGRLPGTLLDDEHSDWPGEDG